MSPRSMTSPGTTVLVTVLAAVLVALVLGITLGPQRQRLGTASAGDPDLASRVRAVAGDTGGLRSLVVAEVTADSITWAGVGNAGPGRHRVAPPGLDTPYELGSITKTFTAALLAEAIARGEVSADDELGTYLPELAGSPAGAVTLGSLAQHRSGLPALGRTALVGGMPAAILNDNPYGSSTTEQLIMDAKSATVDPDQPPTYSNFGVALLGTALVRAAGAPDYPTLVTERVTGPVGMDHTTFAATPADVPAGAAPGHHRNGFPAPRWTGQGYLPAGTSTFTTIGDLSRWAQVQLSGDGPGSAALAPTADFSGDERIGWVWITSQVPGAEGQPAHTITWHNGMTAGFATMLMLDRESGRAVVVMGNSATPVDSIATALLYGTPVPAGPPMPVRLAAWFTAGLALVCSAAALLRAWRAEAVLPVINSLLVAAFGLLLLWCRGPWTTVGGWLYGLALAPALAAAVVLALRARSMPFRPTRRAWLSWTELALSLGLVLGITQLW